MKKFIFTKCFIVLSLVFLALNSSRTDLVFGLPFFALVAVVELIVIFAIDFLIYKFFGQTEEGLLKIRKWSIILIILLVVSGSLFPTIYSTLNKTQRGSSSDITIPVPMLISQ